MINNNNTANFSNWGSWATFVWGIVIVVVMSFSQMFAIGLWFGLNNKTPTATDFMEITNGNEIALMTIFNAVVCCAVIFGIIKLKKYSNIKNYLALNKVALKVVLKWIVFMIPLMVIAEILPYFTKDTTASKFMIASFLTAKPLIYFAFAVVIAAPIFEEIFFRGFLLKGFETSRLGQYGAALLTSATWAAIHLQYDIYYIGLIFCLGLLFATARFKTNSLITPIIMHMIFNSLSLVQLLLM
jgi:uncharacterized protein